MANTPNLQQIQKSRTTAAILAIFLGGLGVHQFYLGNTQWGVIFLLLGLTGISETLGIVQGVIYLTRTDEEFHQKYVVEKRIF